MSKAKKRSRKHLRKIAKLLADQYGGCDAPMAVNEARYHLDRAYHLLQDKDPKWH